MSIWSHSLGIAAFGAVVAVAVSAANLAGARVHRRWTLRARRGKLPKVARGEGAEQPPVEGKEESLDDRWGRKLREEGDA